MAWVRSLLRQPGLASISNLARVHLFGHLRHHPTCLFHCMNLKWFYSNFVILTFLSKELSIARTGLIPLLYCLFQRNEIAFFLCYFLTINLICDAVFAIDEQFLMTRYDHYFSRCAYFVIRRVWTYASLYWYYLSFFQCLEHHAWFDSFSIHSNAIPKQLFQ